jgi:hypothetical protein
LWRGRLDPCDGAHEIKKRVASRMDHMGF